MSFADASAETPERKPWTVGMAPAYINTFLWVAWLDKIGVRALSVGGLLPAVLGVLVAAILAYLLLYRTPASWGFATRRPLDQLAAATFGMRGARAIPNLPIALGQVILFALGIAYATGWMLDGLRVVGLIDPRAVRAVIWGGTTVPSPLFLVTALVWGIVTALVGMGIVRWIAAIMQYFAVFPAACLALVMAVNLTGLRSFVAPGVDPESGRVVALRTGWLIAFLTTLQWTFAFAALPALTGADWGAASPTKRDVMRGGWVSVALAPVIIASLALLAICGSEGRTQGQAATEVGWANLPPAPGGASPTNFEVTGLDRPNASGATTLRAAIEGGLDRRVASAILIIFGLASLATACYAAFEFSRRLVGIAPGISKPIWTLIGAISAWFLLVGGWHERTEIIFTVLGGLFAPVAGAMVADATRAARTGWPDPRPGVNLAGMLAWVTGAGVALVPLLWRLLDRRGPRTPLPAAIFGFLAALIFYWIAAAVGLEAKQTTDQIDPQPA